MQLSVGVVGDVVGTPLGGGWKYKWLHFCLVGKYRPMGRFIGKWHDLFGKLSQ